MANSTPTAEMAEYSPSAEPEISTPLAEAEPEVTVEPEAETETNVPMAEAFSQNEITLWIVLYSIWIILIIALNIATIVSLIQAKVISKKISNMFLLSLIVARTAIAVLVMPARITGLFSNELLGPTLCKLCHLCGSGSSASSVFSTCGVAVAKYLEIKHPDINIPTKSGVYGVVFIWITGFLYGVRAYFLNDLVLVNTFLGSIWACSADPSKQLENQVFIFVDLVVMFVIPLILILWCYCNVLHVLKHNLQTKVFNLIKQPNGVYKEDLTPTDTQTEDVEKEQENIKSIKMLIGVMAAFIICYAAVYVWKLYIFFAKVNVFTAHFVTVEQVVYLIAYSNPWVNVFIYVHFRNDIRKNFCRSCRRQNNTTAPSKAS